MLLLDAYVARLEWSCTVCKESLYVFLYAMQFQFTAERIVVIKPIQAAGRLQYEPLHWTLQAILVVNCTHTNPEVLTKFHIGYCIGIQLAGLWKSTVVVEIRKILW